MGPTRSPSEPVGLHLEVELKPQLKSHVGQKMAAMLMTHVRNGRGQKLMGLARARDPRILRAAGHASTTTMSKSSPHARTQENGSRNHSYFIAYEDRVHITDETVKVCAYYFLRKGISSEKQVIIEHALRTI